jgi:hypothetical protein
MPKDKKNKQSIKNALHEAEKLMIVENVQGIAQGKNKGKDCIVVIVSSPKEEMAGKIPDSVMGYEVVLEFSGPIQALDSLK